MKLKRLFTAVLSTALALSLCAMPAMAADSAAAAMPKTSTSTIDKNQKGSITIYKRALDSSGNVATTSKPRNAKNTSDAPEITPSQPY